MAEYHKDDQTPGCVDSVLNANQLINDENESQLLMEKKFPCQHGEFGIDCRAQENLATSNNRVLEDKGTAVKELPQGSASLKSLEISHGCEQSQSTSSNERINLDYEKSGNRTSKFKHEYKVPVEHLEETEEQGDSKGNEESVQPSSNSDEGANESENGTSALRSLLQRIMSAKKIGLDFEKVMLEVGTSELTVADLWTLIPPKLVTETGKLDQIRKAIPIFNPGHLTETVIDGCLECLGKQNHISLVVDYDVSRQVRDKGSFDDDRWLQCMIKNHQIIFCPVNFYEKHWTVFVVDRRSETRYYLDPDGEEQLILPALQEHLGNLSELVEKNTDWKVSQWRLTKLEHCLQQDDYNCGVLVFYFAECVNKNTAMTEDVDTDAVRQRMLSLLFGSCYDDINSGRKADVCKICKQDDKSDWLRCDRCKQYFHASCIGEDHASLVGQPFRCP